MPFRPELHHRRSIRLKTHDYSEPAHYHIILNTSPGLILCKISDTEIILNTYGQITKRILFELPKIWAFITIDASAIMPNHVHILLEIGQQNTHKVQLGTIIGAFKTLTSKAMNQLDSSPGLRRWHRNYYEKLLIHPEAIHRTRSYIQANPSNWTK